MGDLGKAEIPNFEVHRLRDFTVLYNSPRQDIYLASNRAENRPSQHKMFIISSLTRLQHHERVLCVVITEDYSLMVNSGELIGTAEYVTLYTTFRINRCRYNRVRLSMYVCVCVCVVTTCFGRNRSLSGNTEYQKYLEG